MGEMEKAATEVGRALREAGFEAYFAGGCVRSRLLGLPAKDIDITTSARPEEIEKIFPRTVEVGRAFGVMIVLHGEFQFEVATFRSDGPYLDGRRPSSVTFSDLKSDVLRRDFTINGMVYDPAADQVIDLVGGREDLRARVVRTIGRPGDRFAEDKLRLLRAVRFACVLDFEIERETWETLVRMAPEISVVSAERVRDELKHILVAPGRSRGLDLLHRCGLLPILLPEVAAMEGVAQPANYHPEGDVWAHTKLAMEKLEDPSFELALATLLHDVGKPPTFCVEDRIRFTRHEKVGAEMARGICNRLRLSREQSERVSWMVAQHMTFRQVRDMRPATLKRLMAQDAFPELLLLHRADALASNKDLSALEFVEEVRRAAPDIKPEPLLGGKDLISLGLRPGPAFGEVLRAAYDAQLEGRLRTRDEALEFARKAFSSAGDAK